MNVGLYDMAPLNKKKNFLGLIALNQIMAKSIQDENLNVFFFHKRHKNKSYMSDSI